MQSAFVCASSTTSSWPSPSLVCMRATTGLSSSLPSRKTFSHSRSIAASAGSLAGRSGCWVRGTLLCKQLWWVPSAFLLRRRRSLISFLAQTPLNELASRLPYKLVTVGSPMHEDPCLVLLFEQLRSWSLQTVKGAVAVPGRTEFNVSVVACSASSSEADDCHPLVRLAHVSSPVPNGFVVAGLQFYALLQ